MSAQSPCQSGLVPDETGWRRILRNFTPSWFAVTMGTGIVSILLHELPVDDNASGRWVSYVFFGLNVLLFAVFTVISAARYLLYPEIWSVMLGHPGQSLFLGCFPMGLSTIINMMVLSCRGWGQWVMHLAWSLWWLDVALSLLTCISMPFIVIHRHKPGLNSITAALLLPIVPTIVAASSGAIVAGALEKVGQEQVTIVFSYALWGIGEFFSAIVLALYFHRLIVHSFPAKEVIVSVFLPMGPLGQGGFAIQKLGSLALSLAQDSASPPSGTSSLDVAAAANILHVVGVLLGLLMWSFGLVWLAFAVISLGNLRRFPFNMGWWGFTFPLGVMATCASQLAENLGSSGFFRVVTMIMSLSVCALWLLVAVKTVLLAVTGEIFHAPCLASLRKDGPSPAEANPRIA